MPRIKDDRPTPNWRRILPWAVLGPLGCVCVAAAYTAIAFEKFDEAVFAHAMTTAVIVPLALGVPLFLMFSIKLSELAEANRKLGIVAATDGLTACLNRMAFTTLVETRLDGGMTGALLLIDADHFKRINDCFGHHNGDRALTLIAHAIRASVRRGDAVGRLGGEEFGVFLPGVDREAAKIVAERLRRTVAVTAFVADGMPCELSVSVGGVVFDARSTFEDLFRLADARLYRAKQEGRNRVSLAGYVPDRRGFMTAHG